MKFKKFGYWREHNENYSYNPKIEEYVDVEINNTYEKNKLVGYLNAGGIVAVTSGLAFENPFTKEKFSDSFAVKTDGLYMWPEDLVVYIEHNGVVIPDEWYKYIESNNFKIPEAVKLENPDVDWMYR
jgi:hypothetical protein